MLEKHFLLFLLYVRENGLENIITLVKGKAEAVTLPVEKVGNFFDLERIQREASLHLFSLDLNAEELCLSSGKKKESRFLVFTPFREKLNLKSFMSQLCGPERLVGINSFCNRALNTRAWYKPVILGARQLCVHMFPCEDHSLFDFTSAVLYFIYIYHIHLFHGNI